MLYSQSVEELLKRKKVHREIIFKYLATQGIAVSPSCEKHVLIDRVKQHWSGQLTAHASASGERKTQAEVSAAFWKTWGCLALLLQHNQRKCSDVCPKCGSSPGFRKVLNLFTLGLFGFDCSLVLITSFSGVCAKASLAESSALSYKVY